MSLVSVIKQICDETIKASKPVELITGSVLSINPFKVKIDQRLILTDAHLSGDYANHTYGVGDTVTMLRIQGGKKYYVLPTGGSASTSGEIEYDPDDENLIIEV